MRLPKQVVRIANAVTKLALLVGIPRPPYTRENALIVETVGRRSGKRRRIPVGISTMAAILSSSWRMASALTGSETPSRTTLASGFTFEVHGTKPAYGSSTQIQTATSAE
jgi:hypothetical protein